MQIYINIELKRFNLNICAHTIYNILYKNQTMSQ